MSGLLQASVVLPGQTARVNQAAPSGMSHRNVPWEASTQTSLQQGTEHLPSTSSAHLTGNYIFQLRKLQFSLQGWCLVPAEEQGGFWLGEGLCPGALPMCWALWDEDYHHHSHMEARAEDNGPYLELCPLPS